MRRLDTWELERLVFSRNSHLFVILFVCILGLCSQLFGIFHIPRTQIWVQVWLECFEACLLGKTTRKIVQKILPRSQLKIHVAILQGWVLQTVQRKMLQ